MRYKIIAIKDRASDCFSAPNFSVSVGAAIRSFGDLVNSKDSPVGQHPDDYDLFELGEFNDADGLFDTQIPRQIAIGKDLVRG